MSASGIRAGAAYVELFVKDNRLIKGLNAVSARLKAFGASITALGARLAGLGVALAAPLLGAARHFAAAGDQLNKMSIRTGFSAEALSELGFAAEQSGTDLEQLGRALFRMRRRVANAATSTGPAVRALQELGLNAQALTQMTPEDQFMALVDALGRVGNESRRAQLAFEIFGNSAQQLMPFLNAGTDGIDALRREARRLGLSVSTEQAQAAADLTDAWNRLMRTLKAAAFAIGGALAPSLTQIANWIARVATNLGDWINQNRQTITVIAAVVAGIVGVGAVLMVLGPIISAVGFAIGLRFSESPTATTAVSLLGAAIGFLLSPIGLVVAAVGGITAAVLLATSQGNAALAALGEGFQQLLGAAGTAWQGIQDAIAAGDLAGAMEVAWLGIQVVWQTGIAALSAAWRSFSSFFVELFWNSVYAVARAFNTGWTGIEVAFWTVVNALADGWDTFVTGLQIAFNEFVAFFRRAWARVRNIFSPATARSEIERINREVEEQNRAARQRLDRRVRSRAERVDRARQAGQQREAALGQMQEQERQARQREIEAANAADQERVAAAQRALEQRAAELAARRQEIEAQREAEPQRRGEFDLQGLDQAEAKTDVKGTFSAFAVAGLGSDSLAERTARASEQVARNTGQLVRQAQNGGLVFA